MRRSRVLWLLNQSVLRKSDLVHLSNCGVREFFLPKSFPHTVDSLDWTVDSTQDANLTISPAELAVLNAQDWYADPSAEAWDIANRHFDVVFITGLPQQIKTVVWNFSGAIVLRASGCAEGKTYSDVLRLGVDEATIYKLKSLGDRFWYGATHEHLVNYELELFQRRLCYLPVEYPLSVSRCDAVSQGKLALHCPNIETSNPAKDKYEAFLKRFNKSDYIVLGCQPIDCGDPKVIGTVRHAGLEQLETAAVLFYPSNEYFQIDDTSILAMAAGVPVVFTVHGMLDALGGQYLAGRADDMESASKKITKLMAKDRKTVRDVLLSQSKFLSKFSAETVGQCWRAAWVKIQLSLDIIRHQDKSRTPKSKRVAVVVPLRHRGSDLLEAKLLAEALYLGATQDGGAVEVVIFHQEDKALYADENFRDMNPAIKRRHYRWRNLGAAEAQRAMRYSGLEGWEASADLYCVPDDDVKQLMDCDVWVVISDRVSAPILPLKPVVYMLNDYLQRYEPILKHGADQTYLNAVRLASRVLVTTDFTHNDALQYGGIDRKKIARLPMLVPDVWDVEPTRSRSSSPYFVWATDFHHHVEHKNAFRALKIYYEHLDGILPCRVIGLQTDKFLKSQMPHLFSFVELVKESGQLRKRLTWLGDVSYADRFDLFSGAAFLWHAHKIDSEAHAVVQAASMRVPSLSCVYPVMEEVDQQFSLGLSWMSADTPREMAERLKYMEVNYHHLSSQLPSKDLLAVNALSTVALQYWSEVKQCL